MRPEDRARQQRVAQEYARHVADLERRLEALERSSALRNSSIQDGALTGYVNGELAYQIGTQYDGTNGTVALTGPVPPRASAPETYGVAGGIVVRWDGQFAFDDTGATNDGIVAPLDFARVDVVVNADPDADFIATQPSSAIASARGGEVFIALGTTPVTVALVTRATTGKAAIVSLRKTVTPLPEGTETITAPTESPDVTVTGLSDALVIRADNVPPGTSIQYHISTDPDFVPVPDGPTMSGTATQSTIYVARGLPTGAGGQARGTVTNPPFQPNTTYYVRTIAENSLGAAPTPSAVASGVLDPKALMNLVAATLAAEFIVTGRIVVGQVTIDANTGITIPQPGGGEIHFPVDGLTDATITAKLIARSLTVENGADLYRVSQLFGSLTMTQGVTDPDTQPSVSYTYPSTLVGLRGIGIITSAAEFHGLVPHDSLAGYYVSGWNLNNASGIRAGRLDNGDYLDLATSASRAWCSNFRLVGLTFASNRYYVVGYDMDRDGDVYIYRLTSDFQIENKPNGTPYEIKVSNYDLFGGYKIAMGVSANGNPMIGWYHTDNSVRVQAYTVDLDPPAASSQYVMPSSQTGVTVRQDITYVGSGNYDFGAFRLVVGINNSIMHFVYNGTNTSAGMPVYNRDTAWEFPRANAGIAGLVWDGTRFRQLSTNGYAYQFSRIKTGGQITAAYSWYDDNVDYDPVIGGPSAERESAPSPQRTINFVARSWPTYQTDPAPHAADASAGADAARKVRVYARQGTWDRLDLYLQATLSIGVRMVSLDTIVAPGIPPRTDNSNTIDAQGRRGFIGGSTSPGVIQSKSLRLDGRPRTWFDGQGNARADGLHPPGSGFLWFTDVAPDGTVLALGQALSVSDYPDLAYAWRVLVNGAWNGAYLYGGSSSSGTFNTPDLRKRALTGSSNAASAPVGYTDGHTEPGRALNHDHTIADHDHAAGTLAAGASTSPTVNRDSTGTDTATAGPNHTHTNLTGRTAMKTGMKTDGMSDYLPFFVVNVAIRY